MCRWRRRPGPSPDDALDAAGAGVAAVAAVQGYPLLIQVVGDELYRSTSGTATVANDASRAIPVASARIGRLVHEPAVADLAPVARSFLLATAIDAGLSLTGDIAERLGVGANYISAYRSRLIDAELLRPRDYGDTEFELPHLRGDLQDHVMAHLTDES